MSTSDLYILNRKSTTHLAEFSNGYGSAPCAWEYLGHKYLNPETWSRVNWGPVWALHDDERLQPDERLALLMTFDRSYTPIESIGAAARLCVKFHDRVFNSGLWKGVNHWSAFGDVLVTAGKLHHRARGICLSCTSVSDPWGYPSDEWLDDAWAIEVKEKK